ncbi:MAG: flavodoxin family protein [Deltaproteobacteria bacterium]|nr:flavodoxin family protein [Deltaproteobacteria bacterium]
MKVVAVNGSARKNGNTAVLLTAAIAPLREAGIECEVVDLAGEEVRGCTACGRCGQTKDRRCHGRADFGNVAIEKLLAADGIILGSPVYFADVTAEMKALIDRAGYVSRQNGNSFARKPGAAVIAVRRAGAIHAFDTLNHFFLIGEMIVVGSSYWNIGVGREKGEVEGDVEGMKTMRRLGENMAWLLAKLA